MTGNGRINASGRPALAPVMNGGGGGGGGGSIELRVQGSATCEWLDASGGNGASTDLNHGGGGGGGGGRVLLQAGTVGGCPPDVSSGLGGSVPGVTATNDGSPLTRTEPSHVGGVVQRSAPFVPPEALRFAVLTPSAGAVAPPSVCASGTGEPGATVEVSFDGVLAGQTQVLDTEQWSVCPATELAGGHHVMAALSRDDTGRTAGPLTVELDVFGGPARLGCGCGHGGALLLASLALLLGRATRRATSAR
jgi:hypothetical protein